MRRIDVKGGYAGADPADRVLAVDRVIDRRGAAGGHEKTQLMQRDAVEIWKEHLAEVAVGEGVPDLAPGTGRRPERHLASSSPHRGRAWSAGSFHRLVSMESDGCRLGWIESSDRLPCRGGGCVADSTRLLSGLGE